MSTIVFDNGVKVQFDGTPTPKDVEEVANKLGLKPNTPAEPKDNRGGLEKLTDFIGAKGLTDYFSSKIAEGNTSSQEEKNILKQGEPSAAKVAGSALQVGSLLFPYGAAAKGIGLAAKGLGLGVEAASAAARVGSGATAGYLNDVGSNLQEGKSVGESLVPGAGTVLGGAIPGGGLALGAAKRTLNPIRSGASAVEKMLASNAAGEVDKVAPELMSSLEKNRLETAGKIAQGTTKEAEIAARAIPKIDTTGVKTYADLSSRLDTGIKSKVKQVEAEFAADPTPRKLSELTQKVTAGVGTRSLTGKVNYVSDAVKQLGELYKKTRDLPSALRIKSLAQKAKKEGLTPSEINDLAKEYGRNFKSKGFSKTGEPLTSINDQAFENTRSGLKDTARSFLKSDAAKVADKEASDLIKTKELTDTMVEKVNKLQQRIESRNIVQKMARAAGQAIDIATLGGPKAFVTKLLFPSGVGEKQLTSLDIQGALAKNLALLQSIEKAPDSAVPSLLKELMSKAGLTSLPRSPGDIFLGG